MKVTQKELSNGKIQLEAIATPEEVEKAFSAAYIAFAQQMELQPEIGKTVAQVAEEKLGIKNLDPIVEAQAIEYLVPFALDKKNIYPAFPPKPQGAPPIKRGNEYKLVFEVEPRPSYTLTSYDPVSITIEPFEIDEQEVDAQLKQVAESYAHYVTDDPHPVVLGDSVLLSIEASEGGKPLPALNTEGRTYTTGAGYMPDEFDKNIIGMDVGETKTFTFSGPSVGPGGKEIEQTIETTVTVKEIQKQVIPEISDEWVKENILMFDGVEALKTMIRDQLSASRGSSYENYKRQAAVSELVKRFEGKIADPIYEAMRQSLMTSLQAQLKQQNIPLEQFIQQNGGEQQFGMIMMLQTRQNLIEAYSLDAVFQHEKMVLTEDDIKDACAVMNPQQPQMVREHMESTGCGFALRETASRLKASKWLVEQANITIKSA